MAAYNVQSRNGNTIDVPDFAKLNIDGLQIIGDQTTDWNEPYNLNFLALDKKIQVVEDSMAEDVYTKEEIDTAMAMKIDKVSGKQLSTEDYSTAEKTKLAGLNNYSLPIASSTVSGGIKLGSGLEISNGVVSVVAGGVADSVAWYGVTGTPTTLSGYGITDSYTKTEILTEIDKIKEW